MPAEIPQTCAVWVSQDGLQRIYARRGLAAIQFALLQVFALCGIAVIPESFPSDAALVRLSVIALLFIDAVVSWRVLRAGIVVDGAHLLVRSVAQTTRLAGSDIRMFDAPAPYGRLWGNGIRIVLNSGRTIATGVFGATPATPTPGVAQTSELNDWLAEVRLAGPVPRTLHPIRGGFLDTVRRRAWIAPALLLCGLLFVELVGTIGTLVDPLHFGR